MARSTAPLLTISVTRVGQRIGDRAGERIAAAGDQRDVDAGGDGGVDRVAVGVGHAPLAVEQRPVDVDADQSNHAQSASCLRPWRPDADADERWRLG